MRKNNRWTLAGMVMAVGVLTACSETEGPTGEFVVNPSDDTRIDRRYYGHSLDAVVIARGTATDSTLFWPGLIAATDSAIFVFDWGENRLAKYDHDGEFQGSFGRQGAGPGEFRLGSDMQIGPDGRLHVLDALNRRITVLSNDLEMVYEVRLGNDLGQPQGALPLSEGYLLYSIPSDSALVKITNTGTLIKATPLPWPKDSRIHWMAREGFLLHADSTDLVTYAFKYGNGWIAFHSHRPDVVAKGRFFVDAAFPEVIRKREPGEYSIQFAERAFPTIRGAAASHGCVYVVANDVGSGTESVVDVFDAKTADYVISYRIGYRIDKVAVSNHVLHALGENPLGAFRVVCW